MSWRTVAILSATLAVPTLFAPARAQAQPAAADPPSAGGSQEADELAARREEAGKLADQAYDQMNQARYAEAIALFRQADERFHSPMFMVFIARCEDELGRPADALAHLEAVAGEVLAEYAPNSFRKAQQEARDAIPELMKRVPTVTIAIAGAEGGTVTVDGKPAELGVALRLNPGDHQFVATAGGASQTRQLALSQGATEQLKFQFGAGQSANDGDAGGPSLLAPGIAFGIGGAAALIGAITGGIFVGKAGAHKDACGNDGVCPPELESEGDSIRTLGTVSTIAFVVGGAGVIAGTVLLFIPSSDETAAAARLEVHPTGASLAIPF